MVIRLAPGDPMASTAPSGRLATVGAMLEGSRSPGANRWRPCGCSSSSPSELFSHMPVPGIMTPEPYPAEAVMAHARPSVSTAEVWMVEGESSRPGGRPAGPHPGERPLRHRRRRRRRDGGPGTRAPPLDHHQAPHLLGGPRRERVILGQQQHRRHGRPADGGCGVGGNRPVVGGHHDRLAPDRPIGRQVLGRETAAVVPPSPQPGPADLAGVERLGPPVGDDLQCLGQTFDPHDLALQQAATRRDG